MSEGALDSSYAEYPPIYDDFFNDENKISVSWDAWHHSLSDAIGYSVQSVKLTVGSGQKIHKRQLAMTTSIKISEPDRDLLEGVPNGAHIYNETTNRMNFYENGSWVTFNPVAA